MVGALGNAPSQSEDMGFTVPAVSLAVYAPIKIVAFLIIGGRITTENSIMATLKGYYPLPDPREL